MKIKCNILICVYFRLHRLTAYIYSTYLDTYFAKMWLEDRHGVELRNHTTGGVSVDKLFLGNISVSTYSIIIIYTLALYNHTETGYHAPGIIRKDLVQEKKFAWAVEWSPDKFLQIISDQKTKFCNKLKNFLMDSFVHQKSEHFIKF